MNRPIKILMVGTYVMQKENAEYIHFSSIANGLKKEGYDVSIFLFSVQNSPIIRTLLDKEIKIYEVLINAKNNKTKVLKSLFKISFFVKTLYRLRPNILYVRLGTISAFLVIVAHLLFKNHIVIITEHNGWIAPEARLAGKPEIIVRLGQELQRLSGLCSDKIRAVTNGLKDYLISLGIKDYKIFVQGNGTDTEHFKPLACSPVYHFGFIGFFGKWQGIDWLIEAFALVIKTKPDAKLVIGGTGPELENIQQLINKLNLTDTVTLTGSIKYIDSPDFINSFKIGMALFRPRGSESDDNSLSPLKIRDYAACGRPIITSRIAGLEDIEQNNFGILVPPGDINGYAEAMLSLIENTALTSVMGQKARIYAEKYYSWDLALQNISKHIQNIKLK